jgi:SagB-type dehydrogenase family enzyme
VTASSRLVRNPDLLLCWKEERLLVRDLDTGKALRASSQIVLLLDLFSRPRSAADAAAALEGYQKRSVLSAIGRLSRLGLLLPERLAAGRRSRIRAWKENLASAHYHVASRDIRFLRTPASTDAFLRERIRRSRRPSPFKSCAGPRIPLPGAFGGSADSAPLLRALRSRRTTREFARSPVALEDVAATLHGTWGQTGWLRAGPLGRLPTRTSPSAGSLHPIECYLFAFRVRGLPTGLYHYDSALHALCRLGSGDLRREAVEAAAGQRHVGRAGFLCAMTAVFERTLWKYELENAYRVVWMDAGHLAQTFCLLAVARGLASFTTAAIQDSRLERLLGIDGVREFPVYLCGAGVPKSGVIRT